MAPTMLGVAGFPVAHSRSPQMHGAALAELGLDWSYVKVPVPASLFIETARALGRSGFLGLNVTVPHKEAACELADARSAAVRAIGAANTLTYEPDGTIAADNTDAGGFLAALAADPAGLHAVVLGAGGSARAVAWALVDAGAARVEVVNRTAERAQILAAELGVGVAERPGSCDLLVNCTSVGLADGDPAAGIEQLGLTGVEVPGVVVDLVYGHTPTPVQCWARDGGARFVNGLEVLVHQGALSLERWSGRAAPIAVMRRAAMA